MIEAVQQAMAMSPAERQDADAFLARYQPAQVQEAIAYTLQHAVKPNWGYLRRVLGAKRRRMTYLDYDKFDESTKAKLDRYVVCSGAENVVLTGLEVTPPAHLKPWIREIRYGESSIKREVT